MQVSFPLHSPGFFHCVVNLWSLARLFAATGLNSQPIVKPPPGVELAFVHSHTQYTVHSNQCTWHPVG
jgi:hypothetical protein